ncbi:unnamed protein product [Rhizopus stolonifer]
MRKGLCNEQCEMENKVPAIENLCQNWEACMQKDMIVTKAKVSAEAIAEIINSFTEPISYKTMVNTFKFTSANIFLSRCSFQF